jgi:primosomal protein N' (replication factor Y)
MIKLTLKHKSQEELQSAAAKLAFLLKNQLGARVLGPETPFITRIKNLYIRNILIKMDAEKDAPKTIKDFIAKTFDFVVLQDNIKGLQMHADVDTY